MVINNLRHHEYQSVDFKYKYFLWCYIQQVLGHRDHSKLAWTVAYDCGPLYCCTLVSETPDSYEEEGSRDIGSLFLDPVNHKWYALQYDDS